jgi:iron complex outermembrane receptor protein
MLGVSLTALTAWPISAEEKPALEEEITVTTTNESGGSVTVPGNDDARIIINRTPGGVDLVEGSEIENKLNMSYEDTLSLVPGVSAKKRYGEEVRLSIRGSGVSRGYHLRGIKLTQDGIPFNLADGSADFQELDPEITQRIEVYKGGNALQYGGTSLGGAVNTVSKTGRSDPGFEFSLMGGSYNTYRTNIQGGMATEEYDAYGSVTGTTSSGFREHEDQENLKLNGNVGIRLSDDIETRFYISANNINQELPGSVSRETALNDPEAADPGAITGDWQRDIRSVRVSNKTSWIFGDDEQVDFGVFVNYKDLFHPITSFVGVIDQKSWDYGAFSEFSGSTDIGGYKNSYRIGIIGQLGNTDADVYQNINGSRGALTSETDQRATDIVLYGENSFYVMPDLSLITGVQLTSAGRKVTDYTNPAESARKTYNSINPKVGVLYEPTEDLQIFGNVSHSSEAPTFSELTQGGTVGFTPVEAQKAWTAEIGTRGSMGIVDWDAAIYRAWLKDEMLQFTTGPGIPASTFNADRTIHQGVELGFDVNVANDIVTKGDSLVWRNSYTYSDFYFEGDAQYGDNQIPGIADHVYQSELRYDHNGEWFVAPAIELSGSAYVDYENTIKAPGFGLVNFSAGYTVTDNVSLFLDARNLLDHRYISTFSTIINGAGNTNVYYPGEGRRAFVGLKAQL